MKTLTIELRMVYEIDGEADLETCRRALSKHSLGWDGVILSEDFDGSEDFALILQRAEVLHAETD